MPSSSSDVKRRAVLNVAVDGQYPRYQERLLKSLNLVGYDGPLFKWTNTWPPGSPSHHAVPYGFKSFAIEHAIRNGHTTLLWVDSAVYAIRPLDLIFERIEKEGHFIVIGGDRLGNYTSDAILNRFDVSRERAMELQLVGGTVIGLDMTNPVTAEFFSNLMTHLKLGYFNNHPGSRGDEPVMSLLTYKLGMKHTWLGDLFQGDQKDERGAVLRSGLDGDWEPWKRLPNIVS
jgi:hypothetical protein